MKKSEPKQTHRRTKRKAAQTLAHGASTAVRRHSKVALAGVAVTAILVGAGAWARETWKDVQASDPSNKDAFHIFASEVMNGDFLARDDVSAITGTVRGSPPTIQARVQVSEESRDLGAMAVSEERSAEFLLRNVGGEPLEISQVRTSCMCTFAHVIIDDEQSPAFNMEMHNAPLLQRWAGTVEPGQTATVQLIYKPSLMPVQGPVTRSVRFNTNDPARPIVELSIHANVQ